LSTTHQLQDLLWLGLSEFSIAGFDQLLLASTQVSCMQAVSRDRFSREYHWICRLGWLHSLFGLFAGFSVLRPGWPAVREKVLLELAKGWQEA